MCTLLSSRVLVLAFSYRGYRPHHRICRRFFPRSSFPAIVEIRETSCARICVRLNVNLTLPPPVSDIMFSPNIKRLWMSSLCVSTHFVSSYTRHWLHLPQNLWKCVECGVQRVVCVFGYKMCPHTWATYWIMRSHRWLWMGSKFQAEDLRDCGGFSWKERSKSS